VLLVACFDINIVVFPKKAMKSYKNISENKHSPPQFKILWDFNSLIFTGSQGLLKLLRNLKTRVIFGSLSSDTAFISININNHIRDITIVYCKIKE